MSLSLYTVPQLQTGKYNQNLSPGMASPRANEVSYILHVPDDIAFPKSWENLGIGPGVLEVVGQRAYTRKS